MGRGAVEISALTAGGVQHARPMPLWVREQLQGAHGNNMVLAFKDVDRLVHADPVVAVAASERPVVAWHRTSLGSARLSHVGVSRQTSRGSRAATCPRDAVPGACFSPRMDVELVVGSLPEQAVGRRRARLIVWLISRFP